MAEDKYYIRCFKKELQEYIDGAWDAYGRVYEHIYTKEQIAYVISRDIIRLLEKIKSNGQLRV